MKAAFESSALLAGAILLSAACARRVDPVGTATIQAGTIGNALPPVAKEAPVNAKIVKTPPKGELASAESEACPAGMALVEGEYCPEVEHTCLEWMDPPTSRYANFRCKRYAKTAKCNAPRVHKRFCIDVTERVEAETKLPRHFMSWTSSKKLCESEGARLCRESEWQFACEGEEMRPYPYGWERDSAACNVDISENIGRVGRLVDHRAPVASKASCASPFGVQDMAGNVEEWAQADGPGAGSKMGWKEVLKGSWWIPSRHACRQFQVGHDDVYNGAETGTRCCKDAVKSTSSP
ncbi:MAG: SUMF1/EgtB/PvdO family nonheme iron enzyme [Labilithrix sp.]|nr:SUMF1/EgtB/PvdO family nonheme iron enzyme [Labilithrix sp.]